MARGRTVNNQKFSASVNTVVKGTRQLAAYGSYIKQKFSRGNVVVRTGSFRRGWKWRSQDPSKTYRKEVKTGELAAVSSLMEPCTLLQTWMPRQTFLKRYYINGRGSWLGKD